MNKIEVLITLSVYTEVVEGASSPPKNRHILCLLKCNNQYIYVFFMF